MYVRPVLLTLVILVAFSAFTARGAAAEPVTVVTFDDLIGDNGQVPTFYGGIDWSERWSHYGFDQPPYNAHSRPQRVYATEGSPLPAGTPYERGFSFVAPDQLFAGAWFAGWDTLFPTHTIPAWIRFNLYDDGVLVHTSAPLQPSSTPTFLSAGYAGRIDRVGVQSNYTGYFVMDDVTYGTTASPVPEPGTLLLLGGGLSALVTRRRSFLARS